jgi:transcriptional regulator with XRE-family HTH domain
MHPEDKPPSRAAREQEVAELLQEILDKELAETPSEELAERRRPYEYWEKSFGEKVRQWRRARNWSQEDLANRLRRQGFDMHQTTVAKIERGTRPLRVSEAAAIANIFRVPPIAVFLGPPPEKLPWSMRELHETIETAERMLADMREEMESSARRYVEQQALVFDLANVLNEAALKAETSSKKQEGDEQGKENATEA